MKSLAELNAIDQAAFVAVCGGVFEHSPWVAQRAWTKQPFTSVAALHHAMVEAVRTAGPEEKLALIRAHPNLVGRLAKEGKLTRESTGEQAAAGLMNLDKEEAEMFERYNAAYRERFAFPFVICARENKKEAILAAFPVRLKQTPQAEIETALAEIAKIARLRLADLVQER